jgi:hypothetical protein
MNGISSGLFGILGASEVVVLLIVALVFVGMVALFGAGLFWAATRCRKGAADPVQPLPNPNPSPNLRNP